MQDLTAHAGPAACSVFISNVAGRYITSEQTQTFYTDKNTTKRSRFATFRD